MDYLGINGVFSDIFTMMSLADLGLTTAMAYSFYKPLAENDEEKVAALVTLYRKLYNLIALALTIIGLALVPFLDYVINTDVNIPHLRLYYLIALFNTVVSYLFAYKQSLITADQKFHIIQKYSMWMAIGKIIFQTLVLYITHDYTAYLCVGIVNAIAYNLLVNHQANKYYPYIRERKKIDPKDKKEIYSNVFSVFAYKIAGVLMDGTDNILISSLVSTAAVGLYTNYLTIINRITQLAGSMFWSVTASVGNLVAEGDRNKIVRVFNKMIIIGDCLGGFAVLSLYLLIGDFIRVFFGYQYVMDTKVLIAILANVYLSMVTNPIGMFREASGLYRKVRWITLICAIENIILSVLLGEIYGTFGIISASFISRMTTSFWYEARLLYKELLRERLINYFKKMLFNTLIMLVYGVVLSVIMDIMHPTNLLFWGMKGALCTLIVSGLYYVKYINNTDFRQIVYKVLLALGVKNEFA